MIPNYQELMTPCLKMLMDEEGRSLAQLVPLVIKELKLPDKLKEQTTKSGNPLIYSRIYWAVYYLYRAGLLERARKGYYRITAVGKHALEETGIINNEYLMKFPEFRKFVSKNDGMDQGEPAVTADTSEDPSEQLQQLYDFLHGNLKFDLLKKLQQMDPYEFQNVLLKLFKAMGYGEYEPPVKGADGGVDGIINEDELGVNKIFLQAKRYASDNKIGRETIQMFVGALSGKKVTKGVFITTSDFTENAVLEAQKSNLILINGERLTELMLKYNIGVRPVKEYVIKGLDNDFFEGELDI